VVHIYHYAEPVINFFVNDPKLHKSHSPYYPAVPADSSPTDRHKFTGQNFSYSCQYRNRTFHYFGRSRPI